MFKIQFNDAKIIRSIFESIGSIISEAHLKVNPKELSLTAMDGSHICLVDFHLAKDDCLEFEVDKDYELGFNLGDLVKVLKRAKPTDEITFTHTETIKKLEISMKTESAKKAKLFSIALIDIEFEAIDVEKLEQMTFVNKCQFKAGIMDEAIKDAEIFGEVLSISVDESIKFFAGGMMGDMTYNVESDELISFEFKEPSQSDYAIIFLKNILRIGTITDQINISLKSESPVKMKFRLLNNSYIQYYLAPRVEEDSDGTYEE